MVIYQIVKNRIVSYRIVYYRIVIYRIAFVIYCYRIVYYRIVIYRIMSYRIASTIEVIYRIVIYRIALAIYYYRKNILTFFLLIRFNTSMELTLLAIPTFILIYNTGSYHLFYYSSSSFHHFNLNAFVLSIVMIPLHILAYDPL